MRLDDDYAYGGGDIRGMYQARANEDVREIYHICIYV